MFLFNTLGRKREQFVSIEPRRVGIYVCGPTVQASPHVGHGRAAVAFDVLRRYLEWRGYQVTFVQNVTDIDDKIIAAANARGVETEAVVSQYTEEFQDAYRRLGVKDPDITPRATENIPQIIELIGALIERGHAYPSGGDVYFSVRSFKGYGRLSGRSLDDLLVGARVEPGELKRDPLDFALWKAAKPGEPWWESQWGRGRPGWHIECSAMARRYLPEGIDIHGGGQDLIFPHHENEIAQSEAATGESPFVKYWLHNGLVNLSAGVGGASPPVKMSKSTGQVIDLLNILDTYPAGAVRLFYLRKRFREPLDFSSELLEDATAQLERLATFSRRVEHGQTTSDPALIERFQAAMDDDLNTAEAISVLFDALREGNRRLDAGEDVSELVAAFDEIRKVLGLTFVSRVHADVRLEASLDVSVKRAKLPEETVQSLLSVVDGLADELRRIAIDADVTVGEKAEGESEAAMLAHLLLMHRHTARGQGDFTAADMIRSRLAELGVLLEDTPDGTRLYRG